MRYEPTPTPNDPRGLRAWIAGELRRIADTLNGRTLQLTKLSAEPVRVSDAMLVYADGIGWNPGAGEGFYGRVAGAWVKL